MGSRGFWSFVIAAIIVSSIPGCMRIRPEVPEGGPGSPVATPPPAREEPRPGSAEDYPGESRGRQPAKPEEEEEELEVTWGALPVPVYPGAELIEKSDRIDRGEKPIAYRSFTYTARTSVSRVRAFYRKRLGADIQDYQTGRQVTIIKDLEKGNVLINLVPRSGRTEITIQESQKLEPKKRGLFRRS